MCAQVGYEHVKAMEEHLASDLLGDVKTPDFPWSFGLLAMSFVYKRKNDKNSHEGLDDL